MTEPTELRLRRTLLIRLNEPTILLNKYLRMHRQARRKHTKELAKRVRDYVLEVYGLEDLSKPIARCDVHVTRGSAGLPDWDGLYGGLKPLLDTLVVPSKRNPHGIGLILDDSPVVINSLVAEPTLAPRGAGFTRLIISETLK